MSLLTWYDIYADHIELKFDSNILSSSLINANFVLSIDVASVLTPVVDPFKDIVITRDYSSISRTLILYLNTELASTTTYRLDIQYLRGIANTILPSDHILWTTEIVSPNEDTTVPPTRDPVDVEDYSIKSIDSFLVVPSTNITSINTVDQYPTLDEAYQLDASFTEGRIHLTFNINIAANYISDKYFRVQKKLVASNSLTNWESVSVIVTSDMNDVYIYLPSDDATPMYGEVGLNYWAAGYKYRLRVLSGLGAA